MKPGSNLTALVDPNKSCFVNLSLAPLSFSMNMVGILSSDVQPLSFLSLNLCLLQSPGKWVKTGKQNCRPGQTGWIRTIFCFNFSVVGMGPSPLWPLLNKNLIQTTAITPHSSHPTHCHKCPTNNSSKNNWDQNETSTHACTITCELIVRSYCCWLHKL